MTTEVSYLLSGVVKNNRQRTLEESQKMSDGIGRTTKGQHL